MKPRYAIGMVVLSLALGTSLARADEQAKPDAPATPAAAKISPDARQLIDQISDAYSKLHSLNLAGTVSLDLQVEGSSAEKHSSPFTSAYVAPNRFRHEVKGDVLIGNTGQTLYTFQAEPNAYTQAEAPKEKVASKDLPKSVATLLAMQDPSLLLAISKNAGDELLDGVTEATKVDDTKVGDASCPTLKLVNSDKSVATVAVDPSTHLVRQMTLDMTEQLKQRRPDLARAVVTTDYSKSSPDENAAKDELFAWSPPPGARDAAAMAAAQPKDEADASALEGKDAPLFKLDGLDGKAVSLADLKGKVVVLDLWATWCPPCRASLPHLNKLWDAMKDKDVKIYAVNEQEEKKDVQGFVDSTKLTVPVLLDSDGKMGGQYGATAIPETVVVGKDGKVKKVFVGFNPGETPEQLKSAVESAQKE
ncbi:MAG TPA: redoxin family protein [Tepidisphaeraceae bacterium]|jgi:peroxiredoxin